MEGKLFSLDKLYFELMETIERRKKWMNEWRKRSLANIFITVSLINILYPFIYKQSVVFVRGCPSSPDTLKFSSDTQKLAKLNGKKGFGHQHISELLLLVGHPRQILRTPLPFALNNHLLIANSYYIICKQRILYFQW